MALINTKNTVLKYFIIVGWLYMCWIVGHSVYKKDNFGLLYICCTYFEYTNDRILMSEWRWLATRDETCEWNTLYSGKDIMRGWHELNVHDVSRTYYTRTRILTYCPESRTMKNQSRGSSCRTFKLSHIHINGESRERFSTIKIFAYHRNYRCPDDDSGRATLNWPRKSTTG